MDFRQANYFVALYEEGNITKAAKRLHVVQPAVSMLIRRLEAEYGVVLFDRTSTGVIANATADQLYPLCREMLQHSARLETVLRSASGDLAGMASLGVPPTLASPALADLLDEFTEKHPRVRLRIQEGYSASLLEWLLRGELDAAIVVSGHSEQRLTFSMLAREDLVVAAGPHTVWAASRITVAELNSFKLVLPTASNTLRTILETQLKATGVTVQPTMEVDSLTTVLGLLRSPGWVSILPRSAVEAHGSDGRLRAIEMEPTVQRGLMLAHLPHRPLTPALTRLVEQITQRLYVR